jgi:hypothetical protein
VRRVTFLVRPTFVHGQTPQQKVAPRTTTAQAEALIREVSATVEQLRLIPYRVLLHASFGPPASCWSTASSAPSAS